MNVIKRSGEEVTFDLEKIFNAIKKANLATLHTPMSDEDIFNVSKSLKTK